MASNPGALTITIRRPLLWVAVIVIGSLVLAGYLTYRQWDRETPAYHLQLAGTAWAVAGIGDSPAQEHETLTFNTTGRAVVTTGCGSFDIGWGQDTDGGALGFDTPSAAPSGCDPSAAAYDDMLRRALVGTRSWLYVDDKHIELHGADVVKLVRP